MEALEPLRLLAVVVPNYMEQTIIPNPFSFSSFSPADWDGDGDTDIIGYQHGTLTLLAQQSNGTFAASPAGLGSAYRTYLIPADLDLDGDMDLVMADSSGQLGQPSFSVVVSLNDGTGHFATEQAQPLNGIPTSLNCADLDRDGDIDIVATYWYGAVGAELYTNDGNGGITISSIVDGAGTDTDSCTAAADIDGDDDVDLIFPIRSQQDANSTRNTLRILRNNGSGIFTFDQDIKIGKDITTAVAAGDFDDDGDVDLITTCWTGTGTVAVVLHNDGSGSFPTRSETPLSNSNVPSHVISLADLNGDSAADVLTFMPLFNDGAGRIVTTPLNRPNSAMEQFPLPDMNGDGRIDVVSWNTVWYSSGYSDTTRPVVTRPHFNFSPQAGAPSVSLDFSEDVRKSLTASDFKILNLTTGELIDSASLRLSYNSGDIVSVLLPKALTDGNYRLTLAADAVADIAKNTLGNDFDFDFTALAGDANRDRVINAADLGVLSTNWQGTSKSFSQGDFNYDGKVDIKDLAIVAAHWQQTLLPPPPPAVVSTGLPSPAKRAPARVATLVI